VTADTTLDAVDAGTAQAVEARAAARPGWPVMWRIELVKLSAQLKVRLALAACVLVPLAVILFESFQTTTPGDTLFGQWIHETGYADALFLLAFLSQWGLPFLAAIVAGDICSEEDRRHTWSLVLTRSESRGEVLAGKVLAACTYSVVAIVLLGGSATLFGVLIVGSRPVIGLSGSPLSPGTALQATVLSWVLMLAPVLAVTALAVLISVASRNTWVGVVGPVLVMFVIGFIGQVSTVDPIRPFLPTTSFDAWHGLVRGVAYTNQVWTAVAVSALWIVVCLTGAALLFLRRDVVEG
jgi:ABC-2 type transport system permease protein